MKRAVLSVLTGLLLSAVCGFAAPAAPAAPSADDKEGTISGLPIKRPQGGWLGIEIKEGVFRLTFYNDKKKPVQADRSSAILRWPVHYQPNPERTQLVPSDDPAVFTSDYPVKPPHTFKLHIALLTDGSSEVESYVIDFTSN
jgi:hypothetical protein